MRGEEEGVRKDGGEDDVVTSRDARNKSAGGGWDIYDETVESLFVSSCDDLEVSGCTGWSATFRVDGDWFRCSNRCGRVRRRHDISLSLSHCGV